MDSEKIYIKNEVRKALKWILRSGTAQLLAGTFFAGLIAYINQEIGLTVFVVNMISVIGQGTFNYLDYLRAKQLELPEDK